MITPMNNAPRPMLAPTGSMVPLSTSPTTAIPTDAAQSTMISYGATNAAAPQPVALRLGGRRAAMLRGKKHSVRGGGSLAELEEEVQTVEQHQHRGDHQA